jgi:DNA-binding Lrp family transcriptional regulator
MQCYLISGDYDYLLCLVSRNINHYQERIGSMLEGSMLERNIGIEKYFSYAALSNREERPLT